MLRLGKTNNNIARGLLEKLVVFCVASNDDEQAAMITKTLLLMARVQQASSETAFLSV